MVKLPRNIFPNGKKFRAKIYVRGKVVRGPSRSRVADAQKDLVKLRAEHPTVRKLPKYVSRHQGFREGYRAKRQIFEKQRTAPLRKTLQAATADASLLSNAKTALELSQIEFPT